jgi:hypothetical protein
MVRVLTHRVHDMTAFALHLARPMPVLLLLFHLFFFQIIEAWMPQLLLIKNQPELFMMSPVQEKTYDFSFGHRFGSLPLENLERLSPETIKELILDGEKGKLKNRLDPLVFDALRLAEFYRLDPFWFLSVMKVESHFKSSAVSHMKAQGLMQIMPNTATDIFHRMNRQIEPELARQMMQDERINMEMGAYYLKYLLKKFNYNYKHATIAYNMGPYWVIRNLREGNAVGRRNFYWTKVKRAYRNISRAYRNHLRAPKRIPSLVLK